MGVTISDVAQKANVSPSTVSRVINNKGQISPTTIKKVEKAIGELGYKPKKKKIETRISETEKVGIIFYDRFGEDNLSNAPFYNEVIKGVEHSLKKHNYQLIFSTVTGDVKKDNNLIENLIADPQLVGLILAGYDIEKNIILKIKESGIPLVLVDNDFWDEKIDCIVNDNVDGAYHMTNYLLKLGHKKIALLCGSLRHLSLDERYQGFKKSIKEAGLKLNDQLTVFCEKSLLTVDDGYNAIINLLNGLNETEFPTAIFALNDELAIGALKAVRVMGLNIPGDISVAGFDDIEMAKYTTPSLTTVKIFKGEMGRLTGNRLSELIKNNNSKAIKTIVSGELIFRESTGKN